MASAGRFRRGAADGPRTKDRIKMSDRPSHNLDGLDIDLARRIDEVCRRFEADWREGRQPRIEDYLVDVSRRGPTRTPGRAGGPGARAAPVGGDGRARGRPCHGSEPRRRRTCPRSPSADHRPGRRPRSLSRAWRAPRSTTTPPCRPDRHDQATVDARTRSVRPSPMPDRRPASATSATTRSSARSPAAAWASSSRPGR